VAMSLFPSKGIFSPTISTQANLVNLVQVSSEVMTNCPSINMPTSDPIARGMLREVSRFPNPVPKVSHYRSSKQEVD